MEEFKTRLEMAKGFLFELLKDAGLVQLYNECIVEDFFYNPLTNTSNAYRAALTIFDNIINK